MAHPQIQAHRGWSGRYPENTCLAYERALDLPIEGIELDVQLSADGVPVVIHDATVDRTTGSHGRVASYTARELARLNAAAHWPASTRPGFRSSNLKRQVLEQGLAFQPIPTLEQALTAIWMARPEAIVNMELKVYRAGGRALVDAVVPVARELARRMSVPFRCVRFSSFRHTCLE
ncbi:MAG: hypothetical protein K6T68_14575, partial [Alicyclobacillus shizuokensis]|nr:hypothetical protein [Alicyclobacillus shizuokensis]